MRLLRLVFLLGLCSVLAAAARAAELAPAFTTAEIDAAQSRAFADGTALAPPSLDTLAVTFGLQTGKPAWATGPLTARARHFRVAFTRPVTLGTVITAYTGPTTRAFQPLTGRYVSILKPDAPYPGDVTKDEQWTLLPPGELKILPPGTQTRAIRFSDVAASDRMAPWEVTLTPALCFTERYYSALDLGNARHSGKTGTPDVLLASWADPQPIAGIVFIGLNAQVAQIQVLKPDATEHPAVAAAIFWKHLPDCPGAPVVVYRCDPPVTTRGIRLTGPNRGLDDRSYFHTVIPLVHMGDRATAPTLQLPPPPYKINYTMPMDGFVALDITEKQTGKIVRRLIAETARMKGPVAESWDLKDNAGEYVPPGDYTWKAITRPPFKLTYEMTVNNAGQPAWWAPAPGKGGGGWLGDHGCPNAAAAVGDRIFLGSFCAESGNVALAADLDGNKQWGTFAISYGFRGPDRIVSDGQSAYLVNNAIIMKVDPDNAFKARTIFTFKHTNELPGNGEEADTLYLRGGAAARGDKIYMAVNAPPESWLKTSFPPEVLDSRRCMPVAFLQKGNGHRSIKGDKIYGESEYDELMRLYAAFLTEFMPEQTTSYAGAFIPSSTQAYFGDAPKEGALSGTLTAVFTQPVPVGSVLVPDARVKVYALKAGVQLPDAEPAPGDVDLGVGGDAGEADGGKLDENTWIPLPVTAQPGAPALALAPVGGLRTTALRFVANRIAFAMVMAHRFENSAAQATPAYVEGTATKAGGWAADRAQTAPITVINPARYALVWPTPQPVRGVSLTFPLGTTIAVDVWTGPADGDPQAGLAEDGKWKQMGVLQPQIFQGYFGQTATVRNVDFGEILTTRAVRVRVTAADSGTGGGQHVGFQSLVVYHHLGGDPAGLPVVLNERITEFQLPKDEKSDAVILREIPFKKPNNLAFDNAGVLHCVSDGQIVTVPLAAGETSKTVITRDKLTKPASITFDADGLLYVSDCGPKVINVFNPKTGALVRTIGKPGGQQLGKWDPERFDNPAQIAIDSKGKLWVADFSYQPKRVERLTRDGKPEKWFLGPTQYGGGGWLDEGNHNVVNFNGMKFVIDWPTRSWKLDSILFRPSDPRSTGGAMPDRVVYLKGRRYLVGPSCGYFVGTGATICQERGDIAVPMVAAGKLDQWWDIDQRPDLQKAFGALDRSKYLFVWADKNGDGKPEADEVQVTPNTQRLTMTVGSDLSINYAGARLRPTGFQPNGVPIYDIAKIEPVLAKSDYASHSWTTEDGRTFCVSTYMLAPDGKTQLWEYPNKFDIHGGFYAAGFGYDRPPGVLNQEHVPVGHFTVGKEEYFVTNSDPGDWYVYSGDGMMVGCIFGGPTGYGLKQWTMPEWEPGKTDLYDLRLGQEHYQGCVVKAEDGKIYAVAGHNHVSIVRIDGFEQVQRLGGDVTISQEELAKTQAWQLQCATALKVQQEAKVAKVPYLENPIQVNGSLDDWPDDLFVPIHDFWKLGLYRNDFITYAQGAFAYDDTYLYLAVRTMDDSPMRNTAQDPAFLFKGGDAADICLGLDPNADPKRTSPAPGDLRLLIAKVKDEPTVVLYRAVVPGTKGEKRVRFKSPVGENYIDEVRVLDNAQAAFALNDGDWGWVMEAAIPWKDLGVAPPKVGSRLRGDIGILQSDQNGMRTTSRLYWSGKSQTIVCDVPSESKLSPSLWGELYFTEPDKAMHFGPADVDLGDDK